MDPPATPSPTVAQPQHPLALKVMRLSRPALAEQRSALYVDGSPRSDSATPPLPQTLVAVERAYDPAMNVMAVKRMDSASVATLNAKHVPAPRAMDLLTGDGDDGLSEELAGVSIAPGATLAATPTMDMRDYALSSLLTLPAAFGNIYLGETFVAYLSVGPSGPLADPLVRNVSFKVELQTTALRFALYDSDAHAASATSSHALEFTVRHEIKELGTHILVCQVQYMHGDEQRSFRKFYKFQVLNPLAVKTKINTIPADDRVFIEAQVQNVTQGAMIMEKMNLLPADTFRCRDMSICDDGTSVFDSVLQPQDVRQYLYVLESTTLASRSTTALGKLDIAWRTAFGEVGRLQTSMMQRKLLTAATLEQAVVFSVLNAAPGEVEVPMTVQCRVRNVSPTARTVYMCLNEEQPVANVANTALHIIGDARRALGTLQPGASVDFSLDVLPLSTGLQRVAGLQLMDVAAATGERCDVDLTCFIGGAEDMLAR